MCRKIWYDEKSKKSCKIYKELNKALGWSDRQSIDWVVDHIVATGFRCDFQLKCALRKRTMWL